jgi:proton-translocating NADH-quinone oxidoreductase chain N
MGTLPIDFTPPLNLLLLGALATPIAHSLGARLRGWAGKGCAMVSLTLSGAALAPLYLRTRSGPLAVGPSGGSGSPACAFLSIDTASILLAGVAIMLGLAAAVYSTRYREREGGDAEYYTLLLLMVAGMVGVGFSGDLLTLFVFWELMSVASYVLVAFESEAAEPVEAGLKYTIMSAAGNIALLLGMALLYGLTGTLNMSHMAQVFGAQAGSAAQDVWQGVALTLVLVGFGTKAAIVPFHTWLPDAHPAAPSPISAMLSGGLIKAGAYGLIRVCMTIFWPLSGAWQPVLLLLALLTMTTGNLLALVQQDLKRLLAFSSIAQIGYIVFGLATGTFDGLTGSLFHLLNHALAKGLLFLCAGAFLYATGTRRIRELSGMARQNPGLGGAFAVGMLALAGLPGLNIFMSEIWLIRGGIAAAHILPTGVLVANVLLSVMYYLRTIQVIVVGQRTPTVAGARELPAAMLAPMAILATLCLVIGLYPDPFVRFASQAAAMVWQGPAPQAILTSGGLLR